MRNGLRPPFLSVVLACGSLALATHLAAGADEPDPNRFVMETVVSRPGPGNGPLMRTTTLFAGDVAYDVVHGNPPDTARFDFQSQVVDLASRSRRLRTQLPFNDLQRFDAALRARAEQREGFGSFLAHPRFAKEFDAKRNTLTLTSDWLSYEVQIAEARADVVGRITTFSNWSARLGSMLSPGSVPAPARLELNLALQKQNWLAQRITRRGGASAPGPGVIESRHTLRPWQDSDLDLIGGIEKDLKDFSPVSFSEFRAAQLSARPTIKK